MITVPWPAGGSVLAGIGSFALVGYLWQYRGEPGVNWFIATLLTQSLWCLAYGVGLFVFDPQLRWGFEVLTWTGMVWTSVFFLAFGLDYTGRGHLVKTWTFRSLFVLPAVTTVLVVTNPIHHLVWRGFRLVPTVGAATVLYDFQYWAYLAVGGVSVFAALGTMLLFDTVLSYGPLYRRAAAAVALSPFPPGVALLIWLLGVGPAPQLNLAPIMFLGHVALDAYAFVGSDMFEFNPATRRKGERAAIDDLASPVAVVNDDAEIVTLNDAAYDLFDVEKESGFGRPLESFLVSSVDLTADDQMVAVDNDDARRVFTLSASRLQYNDRRLGHTVTFQDVTEREQRKQRLQVLNRVLRHNLRNDLTVVRETLEEVDDRVEGDDVTVLLARARRQTNDLVGLAEKARQFERTLENDRRQTETVAIRDIVETIAEEYDRPTDGIDVQIPDDFTVESDRTLLWIALQNLLENAIEHGDEQVVVTGERDDASEHVTITVADDGPGIPEHELQAVEDGKESALVHGSGLGLWLVKWAVSTIGGEVVFETDESGTAVTLQLPGSVDDAPNGSA